REDREVEDGVSDHDVQSRDEEIRIAQALEDGGAEEGGGVERPEADGIVEEEPHRDHRAAEESRHDALANDVDPPADQAPRKAWVAPVEVVEHRRRGDEVSGEDLPPG